MTRLDSQTRPAETEPEPEDDFWTNRYHWCALAAGFLAASEGRVGDSGYVRRLADEFYETGAFRDRVPPRKPRLSKLDIDDEQR